MYSFHSLQENLKHGNRGETVDIATGFHSLQENLKLDEDALREAQANEFPFLTGKFEANQPLTA